MSEPHLPPGSLSDRLADAELAALELDTVYVGERLGLYRALRDGTPVTATELAGRTGTTERYVREWLEQQTAAGFLAVVDAAPSPADRHFFLPPEHLEALVEQDSVRFSAHRAIDAVRAARRLPDLVEAFRTGGGIPPLGWAPEGRAEFNRATYLNLLGNVWLPSIADVDRRLSADPPARVADLACGTGWSSIAMAEAYPRIVVDGLDLDADAIAHASRTAAERGLAGRVRFRAADAAEIDGAGAYDLVTIFEALHDMSRPVEALTAARSLLAPDGWVLVADELVADEFAPPVGERERLIYAWSVVSCLPDAMADPITAATGAVMRPETLGRYAHEAGLATMETLPIVSDQWRFYRLAP